MCALCCAYMILPALSMSFCGQGPMGRAGQGMHLNPMGQGMQPQCETPNHGTVWLISIPHADSQHRAGGAR